MPPGTRRANRGGYAEHDDFEGLPVRQWRTEWVTIAPLPAQEQQHHNDIWAVELPHGMPKDSHLLPPHSQELLRAARSGRLYKRPVLPDDEDVDADGLTGALLDSAKSEGKKEDETETRGFTVRSWKQVPRNIEAPPISYLAKRRKGTITIASRTVQDRSTGPTVTRATVRRTDAAGNPYMEEVTLSEGQSVEGEIISTRVEVANAATADPVTPAQATQRRRPPPPKRKAKAGPGRGRKRMKLPLAANGKPAAAGPRPNYAQAIKLEDQADQGINRDEAPTPNPDSEPADGEDDEDEDDGDDGEEVDDGDEGDEQSDVKPDVTMTDAPYTAADAHGATDGPMSKPKEATPSNHMAPPKPMALAPPLITRPSGSPRPEGSPLKKVILPSPTEPLSTDRRFSGSSQAENARTMPPLKQEPPSTLATQEKHESADRDTVAVATPNVKIEPSEVDSAVPLSNDNSTAQDDALLPPPPDQVGNIDSPRTESKHSDSEGRRDDNASETGATEPASFTQCDSIITEDTIKPDDSASTRFPLSESGAPSEVGTGSGEGTRDFAVPTGQPPSPATRSHAEGGEEQADAGGATQEVETHDI